MVKNPENRTPYSQQWNFTIQRQLMNDLSVDIGYVGNANKRQIGYSSLNTAPIPEPGPVNPRRLMPEFGEWTPATINTIRRTTRCA